MIHVFLWNGWKDPWYIMLPHEVNNEFLWNAWRAARAWKIRWVNDIPSFWDFWLVKYPPEKLDKLYKDFEVLEQNLDEIIKVVPLPKTIWNFDWHYWDWYISFIKWWEKELKKSFPNMSNKEIKDLINEKNLVDWDDEYIKEFTKEDMLLIISFIKKKILEAKEKWETLVFSGD